MAGSDTVRGIGYQQAQAVLAALDVLEEGHGGIRVEGEDDVVDLEVFSPDGTVIHAKQIKTRSADYTWGRSTLVEVLDRWSTLPGSQTATFEFLTDGRLGRTGAEVADLLDRARPQLEDLPSLLGDEGPDTQAFANIDAHIRIDPSTVGEVLLRAERLVAGLLENPSTVRDALEQAELAVGRLFRLLFDRAARPSPEDRVVSAAEIAACIGVSLDSRGSAGWIPTLRSDYLRACTRPRRTGVLGIGSGASGITIAAAEHPTTALQLVDLLDGGRGKALAGRPGSGKTTAAEELREAAASAGRAVVVASAEAYAPGRLAALVADAVGDVLGTTLPSAIGRQVLSDPDATIAIDGVSEIPETTRLELAEEIRLVATSGRGPRLLLIGRDVAALREAFPPAAQPTAYSVLPLSRMRRVEIAREWIVDQKLDDEPHRVAAWIGHQLGEAAENPLLFTMALRLIGADHVGDGRARLYQATVEDLAVRRGATDIFLTMQALGLVFSALLDNERRQTDPHRWSCLMVEAVQQLGATQGVKAETIERSAYRAGLISRVGPLQQIAPIHDSFADFFAGTAHANGHPLPPALNRGDLQRLLFAAELSGVDSTMSALVARDIPFAAPSLAGFDKRSVDGETPWEVEQLLRALMPPDEPTGTRLWRLPDGRVAAGVHNGQSSWIELDGLEGAPPEFVVVDDGGPLTIAVRLWRQSLRRILRSRTRGIGSRRPTNLEDAVELVRSHAEATSVAIGVLIERVAPAGQVEHLCSIAGPVGFHATIEPLETTSFGEQWPVRYRVASDVIVHQGIMSSSESTNIATENYTGHTTVEALIRDSPLADAAEEVTRCLNRAVGLPWL